MNERLKRGIWLYGVAAFVLLMDQMSKYWLVGRRCVLIPGIVNLTTAFNEGVAMSMFSGAGIILPVVTGIVTLLGFLLAGKYAKGTLAYLSCGMILGGAVGNLIDRVMLGYVIDLFEFTFVDFYIFNVADIGITCGAVLCGISILFFEKRDWRTKAQS
ncbi:MAG: signal peptidase II [Clostridia bacterium]|nr:signal peptidase II [Clostridia bacterium]